MSFGCVGHSAQEKLKIRGGGTYVHQIEKQFPKCSLHFYAYASIRRNDVDLDNLTIDELGIYASPDSAMKLSTLHNAKGREYKAVAMIDLHEGKIPFWAARSNAEIDEAKRLFYVGVTRAQRLLLYVTDSSGTRDGPTRFLKSGTGVSIC